MFKHILAVVLVSVVSGCVSDGPNSQTVARPGRTQQVAQAAEKVAASPANSRAQLILGAAY
jgi:hypothetical protein